MAVTPVPLVWTPGAATYNSGRTLPASYTMPAIYACAGFCAYLHGFFAFPAHFHHYRSTCTLSLYAVPHSRFGLTPFRRDILAVRYVRLVTTLFRTAVLPAVYLPSPVTYLATFSFPRPPSFCIHYWFATLLSVQLCCGYSIILYLSFHGLLSLIISL